MEDNRTALEKLRELFSNFLDLEQDLYNLYEQKLDEGELKLDFIFEDHHRLDFYKFISTYSLWQIFYGSTQFLDQEKLPLRKSLFRPWFIGKDFINLTISIGSLSGTISNSNQKGIMNFYTFKDLLQRVHFHSAEHVFKEENKDLKWDLVQVARELKNSRKISITLTRTKKDASAYRQALEQDSLILDTDGYRTRLEHKFQNRVSDVILNDSSVTEQVLRMHLQERLALWGYRFSHILTEDELLEQYKHLKLTSRFPQLMDAALLIDYLPYNSNDDVLNQIELDSYKKQVNYLLAQLDQNLVIELFYSSINLDNVPEFKLK